MRIVGIDPAIRHTGLCRMDSETLEVPLLFREIKPKCYDILSSCWQLRDGIIKLFYEWEIVASETLFVIERQGVGKFSKNEQYHAQFMVFEAINFININYVKPPSVILPYPSQLKHYMKSISVNVESKKTITQDIKGFIGNTDKVFSSHMAEAYCLARMGRAIFNGKWMVIRPPKEMPVIPENWNWKFGQQLLT